MRTLLGIGLGLLLGFGATEALHRADLMRVPFDYLPRQADADIGWHYTPGGRFIFVTEGASHGVFNQDGFNDVSHAREKPAGVYRIAILGNSFVEGFQVPREDAFPARLAGLLQAFRPGSRFEVFSFGLSGNGVAANAVLYDKVVRQYQPDLVVLFYGFADYTQEQLSERAITAAWENGRLVYHVVPLAASEAVRSRGWITLPWIWRDLTKRWTDKSKTEQTRRAVPPPIDPRIYGEPDLVCLPEWRTRYQAFFHNSLNVTHRAMVDFADKVRGSHAKLIVIRIPFPFEVYPKLKGNLPLDSSSWTQSIERIMKAQGNSYQYVDLTPTLIQARQNDAHFFNFRFGRGHWNREGHTLVARQLFDLVRAELGE